MLKFHTAVLPAAASVRQYVSPQLNRFRSFSITYPATDGESNLYLCAINTKSVDDK